MITPKRFSILIAVLAIAIAGCSDDDDNPSDGGSTDTTAPSVTSVTPIDGTHIDVLFNENVTRTSAEDEGNYVIIEEATPSPLNAASAGDTLLVSYAALNSDNRTVSLTTAPTGTAPYEMGIIGVSDASGNSISVSQDRLFTGTDDPDVTAPVIVYRSPGPNATGVGIAAPVNIQFSEISFLDTATWTSTGGDVLFDTIDSGPAYVLQPLMPLANGTVYTITISAHDAALNSTGDISWSFTTTNSTDNTPPYVTSSSPANLATNVSVNANLSLTFSEAINQFVLDVQTTPDVGDGVATWSNSGKTVTFDPDLPLEDNTQFTITLFPNSVEDLSGNGNTEVTTIIFTTGNSLESGRISGTIAGDATSDFADDPTDATVIAPYPFPFSGGEFLVFGSDDVAGNNTYNVQHLPDGVYYPVAVLDSNGDDDIDPEKGDALGAYGANLAIGDMEPDSVEIVGGSQLTDIDFPLFDPSAISGTITYSGAYIEEFHELQIGVFDTTAFDPNAEPAFGTVGFWPYETEWWVGELGEGLTNGVYYVGAYLDANDNAQYDPASDPAGLYGGDNPIAIRIENGSDAVGVVIALEDTGPGTAATSVAWPRSANRAPWLKKFAAALRQQQVTQKK